MLRSLSTRLAASSSPSALTMSSFASASSLSRSSSHSFSVARSLSSLSTINNNKYASAIIARQQSLTSSSSFSHYSTASASSRSSSSSFSAARSGPIVHFNIRRSISTSSALSAPASSSSSSAAAASDDGSSHDGDSSSSSRVWVTRLGVLLFLSAAAFSVYLGSWQVYRRSWKQDLITRRTAALDADPTELSAFLRSRAAAAAASSSSSADADVDAYECRRLVTRGRFLYDRTMLLGPRTPPSADASSTAGTGVGYYLVTPLIVQRTAEDVAAGVPEMVLVNRGWCAKDKCTGGAIGDWESNSKDDIVEVEGVIRKGEPHPKYLSSFDSLASASFVFLDLPLMSTVATIGRDATIASRLSSSSSSSPLSSSASTPDPSPSLLLLDALYINDLHNREMKRRSAGDYVVFTTTPVIHTVYAVTWFSLAAALVALTAIRFGKRGGINVRSMKNQLKRK